MGFHAKYSPSGFYRLMLCPGSNAAQQGRANPNSETSLLGTAAHKMFESSLLGNKTLRDQRTLVMPNDEDVGGSSVLEIDDTDAVRMALDYIDGIPDKVGAVQAEQRVDPAYFTGSKHTSGTLDVCVETEFLGENVIEVMDYKNGFVVVDVEDNSQLILYLLGLIAGRHVQDPNFNDRAYTYKATIIQPQAYHIDGPIRSVYYDYDQLLAFAETYKKAIEVAESESAPRIPGIKQCRYCLAKTTCEELESFAFTEVQGGRDDPRREPWETLEESILKSPESLSTDQLQRVLDIKPLVIGYLEAVAEYASVAYDKGVRGFGYKKVKGRGTTFWKCDAEGTEVFLLDLPTKGSAHVEVTDLYKPRSLATPTQVKSRLKSKLTEEGVKRLDLLIEKGNQKNRLVPETDSAPAIGVDVADYFSPEEK